MAPRLIPPMITAVDFFTFVASAEGFCIDCEHLMRSSVGRVAMKCPLDISRLELIYGRSLTGPSDASEVQMLQISGLFYLTIVESCRVGLFLSLKSLKSVQTLGRR